MVSTGINRDAGSILTGFAHVQQSIGVILTTPIGTRVMRREFGSELFDLIDRPMNDQVILAVYSACVMALARWEPRFAITDLQLTDADASGRLVIEITGRYMPRGHLGDFTVANENARVVIPIARAS